MRGTFRFSPRAWTAFLLIIVLYTVLVFFSAAECHDWARDQAVVQDIAAHMIHRGLLPLHGGEHHLGQVYPSPLLYYLYTASYLLFGLSDLSGLYASAVFNGLGLLLLWWILRGLKQGPFPGLVVVAILVANTTFQFLARFFWPVALTPALTLLAFYSVVRLARGHFRFAPVLTLACFAYEQVHATGALFFLAAHTAALVVVARGWVLQSPSSRPQVRSWVLAGLGVLAAVVAMHIPQLIYAQRSGFGLLTGYYSHMLTGGSEPSGGSSSQGLHTAILFVWNTFNDFLGVRSAGTVVAFLLTLGLAEVARRTVRYVRVGHPRDAFPFALLIVVGIYIVGLSRLQSRFNSYYLFSLFYVPFVIVTLGVFAPLNLLRKIRGSPRMVLRSAVAGSRALVILWVVLMVGSHYRRVQRVAFSQHCAAAGYFLRFQKTAQTVTRESRGRAFDYAVLARSFPTQAAAAPFLLIHNRKEGAVIEANEFTGYRMSELSAILHLQNVWESPRPDIFFCLVFRGLPGGRENELLPLRRGFTLVEPPAANDVIIYRKELWQNGGPSGGTAPHGCSVAASPAVRTLR